MNARLSKVIAFTLSPLLCCKLCWSVSAENMLWKHDEWICMNLVSANHFNYMTLLVVNKHAFTFLVPSCPSSISTLHHLAFRAYIRHLNPEVELQQKGEQWKSLSHSALLSIYIRALWPQVYHSSKQGWIIGISVCLVYDLANTAIHQLPKLNAGIVANH